MAGEAPAGGTVQTGGSEGVKAQLGSARMDIFHDGLEGGKVGDLGERVAGLLEQRGVDDDAVALVAITDRGDFTGFFKELKSLVVCCA
jgi:hypothetical protein